MKVLIIQVVFILLSSTVFAKSEHRLIATRHKPTLISILTQQGFSASQAGSMVADRSELKRIVISADSKVLKKSYAKNKFDLLLFDPTLPQPLLFWRNGEKYKVENFGRAISVKRKKYSGKVYGSILDSIKKQVPSDWVAYRFLDAYRLEYRLSKILSRGADFSFVVEQKYYRGHFVGYGNIVSTSLQVQGRNVKREFVEFAGRGGAFVGEDQLFVDRPFYSPVALMRISSLYQPARKHPVNKRVQAHLGVDFEAAEGSPIYNVQSGVVKRKGYSRAAGHFVVIQHPNKMESFYNHLKAIDKKIFVGRKIPAGALIGEMGSTGYSTRPHLHFAVKKNGRFIDPIYLLRPYYAGAESKIVKMFAAN